MITVIACIIGAMALAGLAAAAGACVYAVRCDVRNEATGRRIAESSKFVRR